MARVPGAPLARVGLRSWLLRSVGLGERLPLWPAGHGSLSGTYVGRRGPLGRARVVASLTEMGPHCNSVSPVM